MNMPANTAPNPPRDLMAPDTEPSDQELETRMKEALDVVLERNARSGEWMRQRLWEAVAQARAIP